MSKTLTDLRTTLDERRKALKALYDEAGGLGQLDLSKITSIKGTDAQKMDELRKRDEELNRLGGEIEQRAALEESARKHDLADRQREDRAREQRDRGIKLPGNDTAPPLKDANIGAVVLKLIGERPGQPFRMDVPDPDGKMKTAFTTSAGWAPESVRIPGLIVAHAEQEPAAIDLIPQLETSQSSVKYLRESAPTNAAAERAEGAAYAESEFALTEVTDPVRTIGHMVPVTDEQLEDVPAAEGYLNLRLGMGVTSRLSSQVVSGNGTGVNLRGLRNVVGIQTESEQSSNDNTQDAIFRGIMKVLSVGRATANGVLIRPTQWQRLRLAKATGSGLYLFGPPSESGATQIWGLRRVLSTEITDKKVLVGDFRYCALYTRRGIQVEVGYNATDFSTGRVTIRAGGRYAFSVLRPAAFCDVTTQ